MNFLLWVIGGAVGGLIGAAIWAAIGYSTNYEVGWIAWGIGVLAGMGVRIAAGEADGKTPGVIAAGMAIASVLLGKFAVIYFLVQGSMGASLAQFETPSDEDMIVAMADSVVAEWEQAGKQVVWPKDVDPETASSQQEYPAIVWQEANKRWTALAVDERETRKAERAEQMQVMMDEFQSQISTAAFKSSFGLFDLLWFALAVMTAFKIGSGMSQNEA
jgi:hypothetical protein